MAGVRLVADTFRSLMPLLERAGIATAQEVDADTLAASLRIEVEKTGVPIQLGTLVSAWALKP